MTDQRIYLDYNAGAPPRPGVAEAMVAALVTGNPSSVHGEGRAARRRVEDARAAVAASLDAPAEAVVFTSGGTEANALALTGCGRSRAVVSAIEHGSVLAAPGATVVPCDRHGVVRLDVLDQVLAADPRPAVVSVMAANNETGVIQPIAEVVRIARAHGALVHVDAVQAYGRMPLSFGESGADLMSVSAHKAGGPSGVGALVVADRVDLAAMRRGGGQERGRRAGTEAAPAIVGFGVAASHVAEGIADAPRLAALRDALEVALPEARVIGAAAPRVSNTTCLVMPGVASATQVMAFDLAGFAVSAGAACSSGKVAASHVLAAMAVELAEASCALRVSIGGRTTEPEIAAFAAAWREMFGRLDRARAAA